LFAGKLMPRLLLSFLLAISACPLFAQAQKETKGTPPAPSGGQASDTLTGIKQITYAPDKDYKIRAGDLLNVGVFPATELSREVYVSPDGKLDMPLIGSIKAAGMTAPELEKALVKSYAKFLAGPTISINMRSFAFRRIGVLGEVNRPGYYDFVEGMRIMDAINAAQGFGAYPKLGKLRILHQDTKQAITYVDFQDLLDGNYKENVVLQMGDVVYVPRTGLSKSSRWLTDNFLPWTTLFSFGVTIYLLADRK